MKSLSQSEAMLVNKHTNKQLSKSATNQSTNWTWTQNHLVRKRALNHLAKLAKPNIYNQPTNCFTYTTNQPTNQLFTKMAFSKRHFQSCSLTKYTIEITPWKNALSKLFPQKKRISQYLALIYSFSNSMEEISRSSGIYVTTFSFSMYLRFSRNTCR